MILYVVNADAGAVLFLSFLRPPLPLKTGVCICLKSVKMYVEINVEMYVKMYVKMCVKMYVEMNVEMNVKMYVKMYVEMCV